MPLPRPTRRLSFSHERCARKAAFRCVACPVNYCHALPQDGNAVWPNATAGTTVQGTCIVANGFTGIAVRTCSANAVWGAITTPCTAIQAPCPAVLDYQSRTNWPSTTAGTTATGTCALGYTFGPNGPPTRVCVGLGTGTWSPNVTNDCIVGTAIRGAGQRIDRRSTSAN